MSLILPLFASVSLYDRLISKMKIACVVFGRRVELNGHSENFMYGMCFENISLPPPNPPAYVTSDLTK